jgi:hypothetical protein
MYIKILQLTEMVNPGHKHTKPPWFNMGALFTHWDAQGLILNC